MGLELTSRYGHVVDHLYYAVNVADDFGGQVFFSRVPGFATQRDNAIFRLDSGVQSTGTFFFFLDVMIVPGKNYPGDLFAESNGAQRLSLALTDNSCSPHINNAVFVPSFRNPASRHSSY